MTRPTAQGFRNVRAAFAGRPSLAALIAAALPPATVLVPRVAAPILVGAAVFALVMHASRLSALARDAWALARQPLVVAASALLAWAAVSTAWSLHPETAAFRAAQALLSLPCLVLVAGAALREQEYQARFADLAFYALGLAGLTVAVAMLFPEQAESLFGRVFYQFRLNRAAVTLCLLLPAGCLLNWRRPARVFILYAACVAGIALSDSESAKLGVAAGTAMFAVAWYFPRVAFAGLAAFALAATLFLPVTLALLRMVISGPLLELFAAGHPELRLEILQQFLLLTGERPIFGWGAESSRFVFDGDVWQLAPHLQVLEQSYMHPHNSFLQAWFEMGVIGAVLAFALLAAGLHLCLFRVAPEYRPFAVSLVTMQMAIAFVSHGAWQSWWIALVGLSIILLAKALRVTGAAAQPGRA